MNKFNFRNNLIFVLYYFSFPIFMYFIEDYGPFFSYNGNVTSHLISRESVKHLKNIGNTSFGLYL